MIIFYLLLIFCLPSIGRSQTLPALSAAKTYFSIWNVGQGQWTTLITATKCSHIDTGGETVEYLQKNLMLLCKNKANFIFLTHWDWDHISFARFVFEKFPKVCLAQGPAVLTTEKSKLAFLGSLKHCDQTKENELISDLNRQNPLYGRNIKKKFSNQSSQVFFLDLYKILIPGDSPTNQEKVWGKQTKINETVGLILGHHGSKTSTSDFLLKNLPHLKWTACSNRKQKYGHPSPQIVTRLRQKQLPLLSTEIWGNIIFEL